MTPSARIRHLKGTAAERSTLSEANAARTLERSFVLATDLADALVLEAALEHRTAHRVVGRLARDLHEAQRGAASVTPQDVATAAQAVLGHGLNIDAAALARALDPRAAVAARRGAGGAATEPMSAMIASQRQQIGAAAAWAEAADAHAAAARSHLLAAARQVAGLV